MTEILAFPASFAQQRMWFLHRLDPEDPSYHVPLLLRMRGPLDIAALAGAFEDTIARQEQLRTSFADIDGELHQQVHPDSRFQLDRHRVEASDVADADLIAHPAVAEVLRHLIDAPFDLGRAGALRAELIELGGEDRLLAIVVHHIVIDGWSLKILLDELDACYRARVAGTPVTLPELSIQYADYAEWQHSRVDGAALDAELAHWRTLFPHGLTDPNLPTDRPRPLERGSSGARHEFDIDAATADAARLLARGDGATLYMVLLSAWAATISRAGGGCDTVTAATLLANRDNPQIVDLIGLFVNTLPIPVDLSGQPTFRALLGRVRRATMDVFAHQDAPIEQIVPALRRPHDTGEVTFPLLFALQNFADSRIRFADLDVVRIDEDERSTRFELELHVWEHPDRLRAAIVYSTDLFDPDTVTRLGRTFATLLRSCCATPDQDPDRIPLPTEAIHPADPPLPTAPLLDDVPERYAAAIERYENVLHDSGMRPGDVVGTAAHPRSAEVLVAAIATLRRGGVWLPLDPRDSDVPLAQEIATVDHWYQNKAWFAVDFRTPGARTLPAPNLTESAHEPTKFTTYPTASTPGSADFTHQPDEPASGPTSSTPDSTNSALGSTEPATRLPVVDLTPDSPAILVASVCGRVLLDRAAVAVQVQTMRQWFPTAAAQTVWLGDAAHAADILWAALTFDRISDTPTPGDADVALGSGAELVGYHGTAIAVGESVATSVHTHTVYGDEARGWRLRIDADASVLCTGELSVRDRFGAVVPHGFRGVICVDGMPTGLRGTASGSRLRVDADRTDDSVWTGRGLVSAARVRDAVLALPQLREAAVLDRTTVAGLRETVAYVSRVSAIDARGVLRLLDDDVLGAVVPTAVVTLPGALPLTASGTIDTAELRRLPVLDAAETERITTAATAAGALTVTTDKPPASPLRRIAAPVVTRPETVEHVTGTGPALADGGEQPDPQWNTLGEALIAAADTSGSIHHIRAEAADTIVEYGELLSRATALATALLHNGSRPGDALVLQSRDTEDFLVGVWACLLAGLVAAPIAAPADYDTPSPQRDRFLRIWQTLRRPLVLAGRDEHNTLRTWRTPDGEPVHATAIEAFSRAPAVTSPATVADTDRATSGASGASGASEVSDAAPTGLTGFRRPPLADPTLPPAGREHDTLRAAGTLDGDPMRVHEIEMFSAAPEKTGTASDALSANGLRAMPVTDPTLPSAVTLPTVTPDDVALLMFTSGSTGEPKGVELTHRNILRRGESLSAVEDFTEPYVSFNWMPLDHVGGIVMWHLRDVYHRVDQIHAPTEWILADPLRWLDCIERYHVTGTWAPNFAFGLVSEAAGAAPDRGWDLSSLRMAMNAGEVIVPAVAAEFLDRLAPHGLAPDVVVPAWGMSETCSAVVYSTRFRSAAARADSAVDLGTPIPGCRIRIVDDADHPRATGEIGRLQVSGGTVTRGYRDLPQQNSASFDAQGWFDTGDLGLLDETGGLRITGRAKDVVIVNGVNYSCHEIEAAVDRLEFTLTSWSAACAVPGSDGEQLAVFFRLTGDIGAAAAVSAIRAAIVATFGISPAVVLPLPDGVITKTEIGKIQRSALRESYERGEFASLVADLASLGVAAGDAGTLADHFFDLTWVPKQPESDAAADPATVITIGTVEGAPPAAVVVDDTVSPAQVLAGLATALSDCHTRIPGAAVTVVTTAAFATDAETADPVHAACAALVETARTELERLRIRHVDTAVWVAATTIAAEISGGAADPVVALREARLVPRLRHTSEPMDTKPPAPGEFYLVSGGRGGVGALVTAHLRRHYGLQLLVTSRSAAAADSDGIRHAVLDPTDRTALIDSVEAAEEHFGRRLDGVFHLAGHFAEHAMADATDADFEASLTAKASVAEALMSLSDTRQGLRWIGFSSVNGVFGAAHAGAYAAANAYLDALTGRWRARGHRAQSIAWSTWHGVGLSRTSTMSDLGRANGYRALDPAEALASLDVCLRRDTPYPLVGLDPRGARVAGLLAVPGATTTDLVLRVDAGSRDRVLGDLGTVRDRFGVPIRVEVAAGAAEEAGAVSDTGGLDSTIASVFGTALRVGEFGIHDNFFDLGGTSISAVRVHALLEDRLGQRFPLADLYRSPTPYRLAHTVRPVEVVTATQRVATRAQRRRAARTSR